MRVRNISPLGALELDGIGIVEAGATVDVPADLAGRPPSAEYLKALDDMVTAVQNVDHQAARDLRKAITGYIDVDGTEVPPLDRGAGLLAQPDNWEPVTLKKGAQSATTAEEAQP